MKKLAAVAMALAAAGCFNSEPARKDRKKAPVKTAGPPVQPPVVQPGGPVQAEHSTGNVGAKEDPPKKDPPPPPERTDVPRGTGVGQRAPELALFDVEGKPFLLSEHRGKSAVLVVFGATW